jgi:small conductance mechanosensitive channel
VDLSAENLQPIIDDLMVTFTEYGLSLIGAIAILIIGWMFAGWVRKKVVRLAEKSDRIDDTVGRFAASIARYAVIMFTLLAVLSQFGVETTSFIAVLGALGLAVGLALQGTLGHVASGVMLMMFRPFKIGDFISAGGCTGTVRGITLFTTELTTGDNVQIIIPNGAVWGSAIENYSAKPTRRIQITAGIGYGDDIDKAMGVLQSIIDDDDRCMKDPAPMIAVGELADSSVNIILRVWVKSSDFWPVTFDLNKAVKLRFDANNIEIPYPQQVVHIEKDQ